MTDLVTILRDAAAHRSEELHDQAADEVERLRTALEQIVRDFGTPRRDYYQAVLIARKALEQ